MCTAVQRKKFMSSCRWGRENTWNRRWMISRMEQLSLSWGRHQRTPAIDTRCTPVHLEYSTLWVHSLLYSIHHIDTVNLKRWQYIPNHNPGESCWILIIFTQIIYPSFLRRRICLCWATPYPKFLVSWPHWSEITNFEPIIARSASAVIPSEKRSINTNRKSTTYFPISLRWSSYVAPKSPKEGSKT